LERLAKEKHSSLLGPIKSYEENPNEERNKDLEVFSFLSKVVLPTKVAEYILILFEKIYIS
jgi:hypothetical protein